MRLTDARGSIPASLASDITGDVSGEDDLSDDDACSNASEDASPAASPSDDSRPAEDLAPSPTASSPASITRTSERIATGPKLALDLGKVQVSGYSSSEDAAASPEPDSICSNKAPLPDTATPTKLPAAAAPQPPPIPQAQQQRYTASIQDEAGEAEGMTTPPRAARPGRPETAPVAGRAAAAAAPSGGNSAAGETRQPEPPARKPTRIPEWSPCSTLSSSGSSSAAYSGNLKLPGSRAGSPSTVLTPEAALRSAKTGGTASADKARRRGVNAELARFFGCSPILQPPTIKLARNNSASPPPASATDEVSVPCYMA